VSNGTSLRLSSTERVEDGRSNGSPRTAMPAPNTTSANARALLTRSGDPPRGAEPFGRRGSVALLDEGHAVEDVSDLHDLSGDVLGDATTVAGES
jgi:hypothetical protein